MAVYVDNMRAQYRGMIMCHMIADSDDELHAMAARIGVARRHHQAPPRFDSHYDICNQMRTLAVKYGAIEIGQRELGCMNLRRRATGELGLPEEAVSWVRNHRRSLREVE